MNEDRAVLIFARYPRLGRVKTRLARRLPEALVLELHSAFLLDTLQSVLAGSWDTLLYLADCSAAEARRWIREQSLPARLQVRIQLGENLGERLQQAHSEVLPTHSGAIFLGSDTPGLPPERVEQAFKLLEQRPVVIGPVSDGGYYLLGLREPRPELFRGIDWGTERVLSQTLQFLNPGEFHLLPEWNDVDRLDDLRELHRKIQSGVAAPATRTAALLETLF